MHGAMHSTALLGLGRDRAGSSHCLRGHGRHAAVMKGAGAGTTRSCCTGPGPGLYQGNTAGGRALHTCLA